jgi:hypothetical protein
MTTRPATITLPEAISASLATRSLTSDPTTLELSTTPRRRKQGGRAGAGLDCEVKRARREGWRE